jgi:polyphosphate kinase
MGWKTKDHLFDRELSWLQFNRRVLEEAQDPSNPLLERVRFLAITGSNLDEFSMVRLDRAQREALPDETGPPAEQAAKRLADIHQAIHAHVEEQAETWRALLEPALAAQGIEILAPARWSDAHRQALAQRYHTDIFPLLTPLALPPEEPSADDARGWPRAYHQVIGLLVALREPSQGALRHGLVQLHGSLPRFLPLGSEDGRWQGALLEEVVRAQLHSLFEGYEIKDSAVFRLTRGADVAVDEELAAGFLEAMHEMLLERGEGRTVRLEIEQGASPALRTLLEAWLRPMPEALFLRDVPLGLRAWFGLADIPGFDALRFPLQSPQPVPELPASESVFDVIRDGDVLLQHPYQSFEPVTRFLQQAADDPRVLAIKQTIYRGSAGSPVAAALERAALNGKQVTALVEVKARFDEANNIHWARRLERAGVQVIYGIAQLKTHCKTAMVVRRDPDRIRRYVHLGTGNYNEKTARVYSDLGLMSCDDALGSDLAAVFNALSGWSQPAGWNKLLVGPTDLKPRMLSFIERETQRSTPEDPGHIRAKVNALVDHDIIKALYQASCAGVRVELNVRGVCCLRPGVPGVSENIRVVSIVGRYLEHARIFWFRNGGQPQVYLGSADWMGRNLERRVEVVFPVQADPLRAELERVLDAYLSDNVKARQLQADGRWERLVPGSDRPFEAQAWLYRRAQRRAREAEERRAREFRPRKAEEEAREPFAG